MDGRMSARNLSPSGACFTVSLPLSGGPQAAAEISHA
jgi:K+-sensing histidine kinase KdpD